MAEHRESFSEDVGGKLLLLAAMLAVFGVIALILMPLGTAFAPTAPPAAEAPAADAAATPAGTEPPPEAPGAPAPGEAAGAAAAPAEANAGPAGPPPMVGALMPGIIMLVLAAIFAGLSGLFLGHARARSEEARAPAATPPQ